MGRPRRLGLALLLVVPACGDGGGDEDAAATRQISAVAAVYPLAWAAEHVAPDAEVSLLAAGGLEAHDLEITPGQREAIQRSDVVLYVGDIGYQPQVESAVESAGGEVVSLSEVAGDQRLLEPGQDPHAHEEAEAGEGGGQPAGEGEPVVDAHIWFDPEVMADVATRTGEAFAAADPDSAEAYGRNAAELSEELAGLRGDLDEILGGDCRHDEAIVSHEAYGYLLEPYGYDQHGVTGTNPEAGASSAELAELVAEIEREGFDYVLTEPVEGRQEAETVARETGVELLEISPLDAVTDEQAEAGFPSLVRHQAAQFARALGC
ncbi:MAG: metal ABC transporter substrate-binding protein [Actinomycetota bacterium]|nr:metal ABC transporter substrate-binding protein [Actinomycetota bacterium]MDP9020312.1 metal ABC transporter substrate-binding protein [Actinomycetota bacterium]